MFKKLKFSKLWALKDLKEKVQKKEQNLSQIHNFSYL